MQSYLLRLFHGTHVAYVSDRACGTYCDFCSLRLASKNLHQKSLHSFGAFFTTIRTDLSQRSLQKLQLISEDDTLRLYVQKLLIKPVEGEILGQGFQWDRHSSGHLEGRLPGLEKLQYLLAHNLPNCRSFHIFTLGGEEDESDALTSSDVVALMLRIVPSISIDAPTSLPLKSFIVDFTSPIMDIQSRGDGTIYARRLLQDRNTNSICAKRLQMGQYRQPSFRTAWAPIQELVLEQNLMLETFDWVMDLIVNATSLRKLSLDVGHYQSGPLLERLCHVSTLSSLESFKLARASTSVEHLSRLIEISYNTLRVISLKHVSAERLSDWPIFLGRLRKHAPFLQSVSIYWLRAYNHELYRRVMFPSLLIDSVVPDSGGRRWILTEKKLKKEKRILGVEYEGPRVDMALDMLVKAVEYI